MGPQRWPYVIAYLDGERSGFQEFGSFEHQIRLSLTWYAEQFPNLVNDRKIEMENIGALAAACVYFCLDTRILAGADSANTSEALQASDQNSTWDFIDHAIDSIVPNFSSYLKAYLRWVFVKKEETVWDLGSRPPVGRYAPAAARRALRASSGGGDSRGGGQRRQGNAPASRGGGGQRDRDQSRNKPRGEQSNKRGVTPPIRNNHSEQERAALDAVKSAISKLRGEPELREVKLHPSNSFFRRLQHKMAVAEGYFSFSTGEGNDRSVVVTRERPEHEENP